jgi:3-oxoacyl-[acyl-carrier protein] reductase
MDEHIIIIGGSSPLALTTAKAFLSHGNRVSILSRKPLDELEFNKDASVRHFTFDLTDITKVDNTFAHIVSSCGPVKRICFFQRYRDGAENTWDGEYLVSLRATSKFIEAFKKQPLLDGDRSVVVVSSPADTGVVLEQGASYHAVKAGLSQMIRYYAVVLGDMGIRVNGVKPAIVLKPRARQFYEQNPALVTLFNRVTPLGRMGQPNDIANAVIFLSSNLASYITGQILSVDGGLSLHEAGSLARLAASISNSELVDPRWESKPD